MLDGRGENGRLIDGTLCFADISRFTALAERLAQRGRMGGEELVETLGRVFSTLLDIAHARGGMLLKFGGDALLLFFPNDASSPDDLAAAVRKCRPRPARGQCRSRDARALREAAKILAFRACVVGSG
jgi:class 3 adenylate cyclase